MILLSICWEWQGLIHSELLSYDQTLFEPFESNHLEVLNFEQQKQSSVSSGQPQNTHFDSDLPKASRAYLLAYGLELEASFTQFPVYGE